MMLSQNFDARELIHKEIWEHPAIGVRAINWLHHNLVPTLEEIKHNTADILTVNNWHWGGNRYNAGLRPSLVIPTMEEINAIITGSGSASKMYSDLVEAFKGVGASLSGHKYGNCADVVPKNITAEELYYHILSNADKYPYIIRIEDINITPGWVHLEVGEKRLGDIEIFKPIGV